MKNIFLYLLSTVLIFSCKKNEIGTAIYGTPQNSDATLAEKVYDIKKGIDPYLPKWSDTMYAARVKNGTAKVFMGNSQIERMIYFNWDATWRDSLAINRGIGGTAWSEKIGYYQQLIYDYVPGDIIFYDGENEYLRWTESTRSVSTTIIPQFNRAIDSVTKKQPKARIFICSMLTPPKLSSLGFASDIDNLNNAYKSRVASDNANFPGRMHFVDIRSIFTTNSGKWETDGIHVKGSYYYEWHNKLKSVLATTPKYPATSSMSGNKLPIASAGADFTTYRTSVTLDGSSSRDPDGFIKSYHWQYISGPTRFSILSPGSAKTGVINLASGAYVFRLTVTDNNNASASDDVKVTVKAR